MKNLQYAYPSSPNAAFFGKSKTGCYILTKNIEGNPITVDFRKHGISRAYDSGKDAKQEFDSINQPIHRYSFFGEMDLHNEERQL